VRANVGPSDYALGRFLGSCAGGENVNVMKDVANEGSPDAAVSLANRDARNEEVPRFCQRRTPERHSVWRMHC